MNVFSVVNTLLWFSLYDSAADHIVKIKGQWKVLFANTSSIISIVSILLPFSGIERIS